MNTLFKISIVVGFALLFGCQELVQDIEFKRLEDLNIETMENKKAILDGNFILYNPNPVGIDIRKAVFDVSLDGKPIGVINQTLDATLPAKGEAGIALNMDLDLKDVLTIDQGGILDMGLKLLRKQELMVEFKGKFSTGKSGLSIPIKVEDGINLSEEIRKSIQQKKNKK